LFVESAELEEGEEMEMTNAAEIHFVAEEKVAHGLEEKNLHGAVSSLIVSTSITFEDMQKVEMGGRGDTVLVRGMAG